MFKKLLGLVLLCILVVIAVVLFRTFTFESKQVTVDPVELPTVTDAVVANLSAAVQIPTISYDDDSKVDLNTFAQLHALIDSTYPLVDSLLTKEKVNEYSLLYTWEGKDPSLDPVVLMGHMDVVPVDDPTAWEEEPFSGKVVNGFIWGRGTLDDKLSVLGLLEAAEALLARGFQPERTILFAFGHDEEISGHQGAESIAKLMKERNIQAQFTLDEGMVITKGLVPGVEKPVALIGIAEKGYVSLDLKVSIPGGHSSMPDKQNSIAAMSEAIDKLYKNPFPAVVSEPLKQFLAYTGPEMTFVNKMAIANMWLLEGVFVGIMEGSTSGNATVRTTTAPTLFHSGIKENLVPAEATATVNFRIIPGQTPNEVKAYVEKIIDNPNIEVSFRGWANPATPVSSVESDAFKTLQTTIGQVFPDAAIAPNLVLGATDSRYYTDVSDDVYRFLPAPLTGEDLNRIHGSNERIAVEDYKNLIVFYQQLMLNIK